MQVCTCSLKSANLSTETIFWGSITITTELLQRSFKVGVCDVYIKGKGSTQVSEIP